MLQHVLFAHSLASLPQATTAPGMQCTARSLSFGWPVAEAQSSAGGRLSGSAEHVPRLLHPSVAGHVASTCFNVTAGERSEWEGVTKGCFGKWKSARLVEVDATMGEKTLRSPQ